jgi:hypothetical protein
VTKENGEVEAAPSDLSRAMGRREQAMDEPGDNQADNYISVSAPGALEALVSRIRFFHQSGRCGVRRI